MISFKIKKLLPPICFFIFLPLIGRKPLKHPRKLKTSVIIPCYYRHAQYLYSLLQLLQNQTTLPDEVVISISECDKIEPSILEALDEEAWIFPVKIIKSNDIHYAGTNRNIACRNATGDIFILQDSDDIPHPQRIEIIKYFFENYNIEHLMHQYFLINSLESEINFSIIKDFKSIPLSAPDDNRYYGEKKFTNGNVTISKEIFNSIKWTNKRRGQDTVFNKKIYRFFKRRMLRIHIPLYGYRIYLSSKNRM